VCKLLSSRSAINPEYFAATIGGNKTLGVNTCPIKFRMGQANRDDYDDDDADVNDG